MHAGSNGLQMFYEIRGTPDPVTVPVVLLPGAISAAGTSSGPCRTCWHKPVRSSPWSSKAMAGPPPKARWKLNRG